MSNEWTPDIVVDARDSLSHHLQVFLDGVLLERCYQARVKYESFDAPAFGELIVGAERDGKRDLSTILYKPALCEFERDGLLVKFACGKVHIVLTERGKEILATIRAAER